jgi:hypothetical protein
MRSWSTAVLSRASLHQSRDAPAVTRSRSPPIAPLLACADALTHRHCPCGVPRSRFCKVPSGSCNGAWSHRFTYSTTHGRLVLASTAKISVLGSGGLLTYRADCP